MALARRTASADAGAATMRLAAVRMPDRWACSTASLTSGARPKSSAVTIGLFSGASPRSRAHAEPVSARRPFGSERAAVGHMIDMVPPMHGAAREARNIYGEGERVANRDHP